MRRFAIPLFLLLATSLGLTAQPIVFEGGVVNAADGTNQPIITPGSLVSIFGSDLASGLSQADSIPLGVALGETSVTFNGIPGPLLFVSQGQVNAQLPWNVLSDGVTQGVVNVVVRRGQTESPAVEIPVGPFSPGVFTFQGKAIAINGDGSLAQPVGSIPTVATHPAPIGSTVVIYATGLGAVNNPVANGANTLDGLRTNLTFPEVFFGGVKQRVIFSGLTPQFVGVNQVNVTILEGTPAGGAVPVLVQSGGVSSPAGATIAVE